MHIHGGFRIETAVTWPLQKRNGYKFIAAICNGHSTTDTRARSGVAVVYDNGRGRWPNPTAFFWCQMFTWNYQGGLRQINILVPQPTIKIRPYSHDGRTAATMHPSERSPESVGRWGVATPTSYIRYGNEYRALGKTNR
jgi:hypothetical protein